CAGDRKVVPRRRVVVVLLDERLEGAHRFGKPACGGASERPVPGGAARAVRGGDGRQEAVLPPGRFRPMGLRSTNTSQYFLDFGIGRLIVENFAQGGGRGDRPV